MANRVEERIVKLGRKFIPPAYILAHHWAVQVGDIWYEVSGLEGNSVDLLLNTNVAKINRISRSRGLVAESGAGYYGGEIVGVTSKADWEINAWIGEWERNNPTYFLFTSNCHNFAYELIVWLTDGVFKVDHSTHSYHCAQKGFLDNSGFATSSGGNAIAFYSVAKGRLKASVFEANLEVGQASAQAVAGPGLGLFLEGKVCEASLKVGNFCGAHVGLNANTGVGIRNGNLEAHLLGLGGKIGADGIEINTPVGGVNACSIM